MEAPQQTLARIVARELKKLDAMSESESLLSGEQLETLEAIAKIIRTLSPTPPEDTAPISQVDVEAALKAVE